MPLAIITLHLVLICAAVMLLALLCSTGNFWRLPGAGVWICLDLMVSITGVAFYLHPEYAAISPRLALFHFVALLACVAWMAVDAGHAAHPLSGVFAYAFASFAVLRVGEAMAIRWHMFMPAVIEIANAIGYLAVVGLLIAALLLPVPPATEQEQTVSLGTSAALAPACQAALMEGSE